MSRKVCMAIVDRANWGRCAPVAEAIRAHPDLELSIICGGSTPLERFKNPADEIRSAGYSVECLYHEIEGSVPVSAARSGGLAQMDFAAALDRLNPDLCYAVGDRYQLLGVAIAAVTLGIPLVHQQGGEVSGALDERYRHAVTKLADWHVPATEKARENIIRMGERPESILAVGCPSADLAAKVTPKPDNYLLVVFHPDTNESEHAAAQMNEVLSAVYGTGERVKCLWPNIDFGSSAISKAIRQFRERCKPEWEFLTNVEPEAYLKLLANASCCVGNSSSFVRDSTYFGTPIVLVGNRQDGRERGENVMDVGPISGVIRAAIRAQFHRRYAPSDLYGKPGVSKVIADRLATLELGVHKRLAYAS